MAEIIRIAPDRLETWSIALLTAAGVPDADAAEIARHLIFADLRGVDTHGTSRLKIYLTRLQAGLIAPGTRTRILQESPVSAVLDGGNGFGQVVARRATELAIAKARETGMAIVTVRNSNHCGCMAYYSLLMAQAGLIGLTATNAPAQMAPYGGKEAFFGTNPFSLAAPGGKEPPFVFDMATSQVARGKIINAAREGKPIPEGWAITRDGLPTTDSKAALAGFVVPVGGAKGSALAFMVEILAGVLTGALIGPQLPKMYEAMNEPQQVGHFFLAFRPDLFMPMTEFTGRMDETVDGLRRVAPAPGFDQVHAPGDIERIRADENRRLGIPIPPGVCKEFRELSAQCRIALPREFAETANR
jgi:LDH2 family malate/lactate/ureidoglycolate dehydrogenase